MAFEAHSLPPAQTPRIPLLRGSAIDSLCPKAFSGPLVTSPVFDPRSGRRSVGGGSVSGFLRAVQHEECDESNLVVRYEDGEGRNRVLWATEKFSSDALSSRNRGLRAYRLAMAEPVDRGFWHIATLR
ncbi:hypothetical protein N7532_008139 [Penicillium argentinense]|uniref:Uncharacterized protein n=1 Tax=Penicillium argentinense TaxID=1131581 RepID=A0A9W9EX32_9EURO|nr:uncharacterized protein N7532_008139 [Penicillium argentinense]KAJ5089455.1 hypothetical protein N7532_008139 [Penicillium argentinense]